MRKLQRIGAAALSVRCRAALMSTILPHPRSSRGYETDAPIVCVLVRARQYVCKCGRACMCSCVRVRAYLLRLPISELKTWGAFG